MAAVVFVEGQQPTPVFDQVIDDIKIPSGELGQNNEKPVLKIEIPSIEFGLTSDDTPSAPTSASSKEDRNSIWTKSISA